MVMMCQVQSQERLNHDQLETGQKICTKRQLIHSSALDAEPTDHSLKRKITVMNRSSKGAASGKPKQALKSKGPAKHKKGYPKLRYLVVLVGFAVAAGILIQEKLIVDHTEPEPDPPSQTDSAPISVPNRYNMLLGRWQRPDGGYIIEISRVNPDGIIVAAYYNPRSINVSKALVEDKHAPIRIFIELNDVGYPGATYSLTYDQQNDVLKGVYYQPSVEQMFEVLFMRMH
jgi:hypothetical protein